MGLWFASKECCEQDLIDFQVMDEDPSYGPHGYLMHDACWQLLRYRFALDITAIGHFYEICHSLPTPLRCLGLSWGHDYGGLVVQNDLNFYPWEDRVQDVDSESLVIQEAREDPFENLDVKRLVEAPSTFPVRRTTCMSKDCFTSLPWEICEIITKSLPLSDIQNLRFASKTFASLYSSQYFWASRFAPGLERDYIFEAKAPLVDMDWRNLYWLTQDRRAPPALRNRKRIWKLLTPIENYLRLCYNSSASKPLHEIFQEGFEWKEISGDIRYDDNSYRPSFHEGCGVMFESAHLIPNELYEIACSMVKASDGSYVVGLRVTDKLQNSIRLGYVSEEEELVCKVTTLKGFNVAVGSRGIRALQIICEDNTASCWLGQYENCPISQRLFHAGAITALRAAFDVCLVVMSQTSNY